MAQRDELLMWLPLKVCDEIVYIRDSLRNAIFRFCSFDEYNIL